MGRTKRPLPVLQAADEFQAGVGVVDGADLDVDETGREEGFTHDVLAEIGGDTAGLLRPKSSA